MISNQRIEESMDLINRRLVQEHVDKDPDSLFVRFGEICQAWEELSFRVASLDQTIARIAQRQRGK